MDLLKGKLVVTMVLALFLTSCNKDKADAPGLSISAAKLIDGIYIASENETVSIKVNVSAPGGFKLLRISFEGISRETEEILPNETGAPTFETTFILKNWLYGASSFSIIFIAVDNENNSSQAKVLIQPGLPDIVLLDNSDIQNDTLFAFTGQLFKVNYRYTFPAGLTQFRNTFFVDGQKESESLVTTLPPTQGTSVTDNITRSLGIEFLGKEMNYSMELTDKFGEKAFLVLPVVLSQKPTALFKAVKMSAPALDGSIASFFSSNSGTVYSPNEVNQTPEVAGQIDFGYYYDITDNSSLTGPANFPTNIYNVGPNGDNWPDLNVTNFKRTSLSVAQFDALDETNQVEIDNAYNDAGGNVLLVIKNLIVNEVVAFKTSGTKPSGTKFGLFKVVSIVPGAAGVGSITIDVVANQ